MADDTQYRQIILAPGYDSKTSVFGLVCSADNGQTFKVYWTPYGRVWYPEDASSFFPLLWPYIEEKIKAGGFSNQRTISWSDIQGRPNVALKSDLPDLSKFAKTSDIPKVDLSGYAKITDIPSDLVHTKDLAEYVKIKDLPKPPDLTGYAKQSAVDSVKQTAENAETKAEQAQLAASDNAETLKTKADKSEIPKSMDWSQLTGRPDVATQSAVDEARSSADSAKSIAQQAQSTAETAQSKADQALTVAQNAQPKIDSSSQQTSKKPSEYSEGFYREIKTMAVMGINRSQLASDAQDGDTALVLTYSYGGFARQTVMVMDSQRPMTYKRNGKADQWFPWEVIHTTGGDWLQG